MNRIPTTREVFASRALYGLHGLELLRRELPDSGPMAVTVCLKYLGEMASERQVADALGAPTPDGIQATTILKYISGRGIRCTGWKGAPFTYLLTRIQQQRLTLVVWPNRAGQYIIPCGYEPDMQMVVFADPERTRFVTLPLKQAEDEWGGQTSSVVISIDRVSATTKGHKHPLNRKQFRLQEYHHSTRKRNEAAAVALSD